MWQLAGSELALEWVTGPHGCHHEVVGSDRHRQTEYEASLPSHSVDQSKGARPAQIQRVGGVTPPLEGALKSHDKVLGFREA